MEQLLFLLLVCSSTVQASRCSGTAKPGPPNNLPIDDSEPVLVKSVKNGHLYTVGANNDISKQVHLVHVYGTAYEMGYAQGALLGDELKEFLPKLFTYLETQVFKNSSTNPYEAWVARIGINLALDLSYEATKKYTPSYVMEEIYGISNATGISADKIRRMQWIGELTRGSCSMYGAWGNATMQSRQGRLLQLRALDWDTDGPFKDYASVVVYHPTPESSSAGHAFANVGFIGWMASVTGMSSQPLAVSEIGVSYPDKSFGPERYLAPGYPFGFVIRDVLQFDQSLTDAIDRITGAKRTCDLILGVGDGKSNSFRGFRYSPDSALVMDDANLLPLEDWHPRIPSVVYWGMDWICENDNRMLSHQLNAYYGNISVHNTIRNMLPYVQTGNLHIAIYDHSAMTMHLAFAADSTYSGPLMNAYQRQYVRLDMARLFDLPPPKKSV